MPSITLKNEGKGPRGFHAANGRPVILTPGEEATADVNDATALKLESMSDNGADLKVVASDGGAVSSDASGPGIQPEGYSIKDKGRGWFAIAKDGEEVTKSLRSGDVEGFDSLSEDEKTAFIEENKADD